MDTKDLGEVHIGDAVTLTDGRNGIAHSFDKHGEIILLSELISCFYPGDIEKVERQKKRIRIHQIMPDIESEYIFKNYDWLLAKGLSAPPAELYEVVYDGQLETDLLEEIFRIFNMNHPQGYTGRSLSVSDIVELYGDNGSSYYFCDSFGYKEIPFNPLKYFYMLVSISERDTTPPQLFASYDDAYLRMREDLLFKLESFDEHTREDDYGIHATHAWTNYRGNSDWFIYRFSIDSKGVMSPVTIPVKTLVIWTQFKSPFAFGNQLTPSGCEVEVVEKLTLGHGHYGYRVPMPNGGDVICEAHSGAIIGNSLETVRENVRAGDAGKMRQQVIVACNEKSKVKKFIPETFWRYYERSISKEAST
jgi:hypothetical protein